MIVAGFGFRRGAGAASLQNALDAAQQGLPAVTHLATAQDKAAALAPLAQRLGLPVVALQGGALILAPTTTLSLASLRARGTGSLAEAAALAAAGPGARLLRIRQISSDRMATCAIAEGPDR